MSMDGMTMEDKCERLEQCGVMNELDDATTDCVQVCSMLHVVEVYVRRVIHVVHNGLTDVEGTLFRNICRSPLFVNFCIRRYCIYKKCTAQPSLCLITFVLGSLQVALLLLNQKTCCVLFIFAFAKFFKQVTELVTIPCYLLFVGGHILDHCIEFGLSLRSLRATCCATCFSSHSKRAPVSTGSNRGETFLVSRAAKCQGSFTPRCHLLVASICFRGPAPISTRPFVAFLCHGPFEGCRCLFNSWQSLFFYEICTKTTGIPCAVYQT